MPTLHELERRGEFTRKCRAQCGLIKSIDKFKIRRVRGREEVTHQCLVCVRSKQRVRYKVTKKKSIKRVKRWKSQNRETVRAYGRSDRAKAAARRRYAESSKRQEQSRKKSAEWYRANKLAHITRKRRQRLESVRASLRSLPSPVIQEYVRQLLVEAAQYENSEQTPKTDIKVMGGETLSTWTGVSTRTIREIVKGQRTTVQFNTVDKLLAHSDFTMVEVLETAKEWALLTGTRWP